MALHEIGLSQNAVDVALSSTEPPGPHIRIAVLHTDTVSLYSWDVRSNPSTSAPIFLHEFVFPLDEPSARSQQLCSVSETRVIVLRSSGRRSELREIHVDLLNKTSSSQCTAYNTIRRIVSPIGHHLDHDVYILLGTNEMIAYRHASKDEPANEDEKAIALGKATVLTPWVEVIEAPANRHGNNEEKKYITFGLSTNGSLYANQRLLARGCTSFLVTSAHLIFTTAQHMLKFVHLGQIEGMRMSKSS